MKDMVPPLALALASVLSVVLPGVRGRFLVLEIRWGLGTLAVGGTAVLLLLFRILNLRVVLDLDLVLAMKLEIPRIKVLVLLLLPRLLLEGVQPNIQSLSRII
jgi:TM2 domain-containing membrane protein YozV